MEGIVATTQEALQISAIVPSFTVDDLQKSMTFYEALGFTVEERWEDKGTLLGVMLRAGITLKSEPHDTEWKTRAFEVIDPSGFVWTIGSEMPA
jgi:hypothetical protein